MPFSNLQIDIASIPTLESVSFTPIHKSYRKVLWWRWTILWLLVAAGATFFVFKMWEIMELWIILLIITAVVFLAFLHQWLTNLSFKNKGYALREYDVLYKEGWLRQTTGVCPLNKVQHCSISAGIFERKYQLASLHLYTAGSGGADMVINGLTQEEANNLKLYLLTKIVDNG